MKLPNCLTSTLSLLALISVVSFCALCVAKGDISSLEKLTMSIVSAYTLKKGVEISQNGKKEEKQNVQP